MLSNFVNFFKSPLVVPVFIGLLGTIIALKEAKAKLVEAVEDGGSGDFQCPICMKKFADPEILIRHHQTAHSDPQPTLAPVPEARLFKYNCKHKIPE